VVVGGAALGGHLGVLGDCGDRAQETRANPGDHRGAGVYHIEVRVNQAEGHAVAEWSEGGAGCG